jgi:hypothetical protein
MTNDKDNKQRSKITTQEEENKDEDNKQGM